MVSAANLFSMMGEFYKQDRIIDENTSVFLYDLELKFKEGNIELPTSQMFCLNKLLYLVNLNYFDEIKEKNPIYNKRKINKSYNRSNYYIL